MKLLTLFVVGAALASLVAQTYAADSALDFKVKSIKGDEVDLNKYKGKVVLVVNVASQCGLTKQYKELESLHETYGEKGLVVLGFPCNQFGKQEPGNEAEIAEFCSSKFNVKFPMFSKLEVNGEGAAPLYKYLTSQKTAPKDKGEISWNFEKFLIGKNGQVVARFAPATVPDAPEVLKLIEAELAK